MNKFFISLLLATQTTFAEKPNIVLIMADDLGWFDTRFQGNKELETPRLDEFVQQGMIFTNGYAAAPVCTPTRAAMMTGMSPARLGITNHAPGHQEGMVPKDRKLAGAKKETFLSLDAVTIAERLKDEAGYATGFVGKWHLSHRKGKDEEGKKWEPQLRPEHQGYDSNVGGYDAGGPNSFFAPFKIPGLEDCKEGDYLPTKMATECISFIEKHKDQPFFLTFWNYSVHYPIEAPKDLIKKYRKRGLKRPAYAAMIEGMDRSIGRILDSLDALNLAENTIVIFTSDNGSLFENGPLRENKGHLYEGGIRVPWAIRWPGKIKSGSSSETPIVSTDIFPTLLEIADLEPAPQTPADGESLIPLLTGTGKLKRDALFFHYPNYAFHKANRLGAAIRKGNHKLIHFFDDDSIELYDLTTDLGETKDLSKPKPGLAKELRNQLDLWLKESGAKLSYEPK